MTSYLTDNDQPRRRLVDECLELSVRPRSIEGINFAALFLPFGSRYYAWWSRVPIGANQGTANARTRFYHNHCVPNRVTVGYDVLQWLC